jgi:signal transduction histidine kinase
MIDSSDRPDRGLPPRFIVIASILLAVAVFALTWITISESRRDSFLLLVKQGTAFTEALALASDNAMEAEQFADYLLQRRYGEIVIRITEQQPDSLTDMFLTRVAQSHGLLAVLAFDTAADLVARGIARPLPGALPAFVEEEVAELWANPEANFSLLLDSENGNEGVLYYLQISNNLSYVILLAEEALFYMDGLRRTQIGYLAQAMAREQGVEYIIYQTTDGIVFASRKPGPLLAIEADPFLRGAFDSDSVSHRTYVFQDKEVLELVRPFATVDYPVGVLRVGLSLETYHDVKRGFDLQMVTVSAVLFLLVLVILLYIQSRLRGRQFRREYRSIKTVTDKVFDEMRTGVAAIDEAGVITMSNRAFDRIFVCGECVGRPWDSVVADTALAFERIRSVPGDTGEIEIAISRGEERRTLLVALSRLEAAGEAGARFVAVVYDISRIRELQEKAARRERLSELGDLAAGVAHEIRNPLNTISIAAQRLASEFSPRQDEEQYMLFTQQIRSETRRLNDIITRFLALARENGRRKSEVDLNDLLVQQVRLWEPEAAQLGIALNLEVAGSPVVVRSDPDALRQVLANLFANAKEALAGEEETVITIELMTDSKRAHLVFADSGPGIPRDIQSKVFTPYFTTKESGTGLGLATVDRIMIDLGGEVRLDTEYTGGARFVLTLPLVSA